MKNRNVLVIIDLQPGFLRSTESVVTAAADLASAAAKKKNALTLLVQYDSKFHELGVTHSKVSGACVGGQHQVVWKYQDDGSGMIELALDGMGVRPKSFSVCGVNTGWCVAHTAAGLAERFEKVDVNVMAGACDDHCDVEEHQMGLERIRMYGAKRPNLKVVA